MRGLIIDYAGVLEGPGADAESWKLLLSELRMNGIGIAVLTNIDSFDVPADLARWKETEDHKDCVCVDDSIENIHAAVRAGLIGVLYTAYDRTAAELRPLFNLH